MMNNEKKFIWFIVSNRNDKKKTFILMIHSNVVQHNLIKHIWYNLSIKNLRLCLAAVSEVNHDQLVCLSKEYFRKQKSDYRREVADLSPCWIFYWEDRWRFFFVVSISIIGSGICVRDDNISLAHIVIAVDTILLMVVSNIIGNRDR